MAAVGGPSSVVVASWVVDALRAAGYPALVALMVAENLFPPIPSEVVLPLAGYEVSRGHFGFAATPSDRLVIRFVRRHREREA